MSVNTCNGRRILKVLLRVWRACRTKKTRQRKLLGTDVVRIDGEKAAPRIQAERQPGIKIRAPNPSSFLAFEGELLPGITVAFDAGQVKLKKMIFQMDFAAKVPLGQFARGQRRRVLQKPLLLDSAPLPPSKLPQRD